MTVEQKLGTSELAAALRSGKQADADGVAVIVSRQACEEAADLIDELNRRTPPAAGQSVSDGDGWIDPNINPEVFDEIARFLEKNYPRELYPLWYSALEHAAWSATEPRFRKYLLARRAKDADWSAVDVTRSAPPPAAAEGKGEWFTPHWPEALKQNEFYKVLCDDKGRHGGSWLRVMIANDGDVHVSMQDWEEVPKGEPDPFPSVRIRTMAGGGRHARTRQALLWLAEAIRLDSLPPAPEMPE